MYKTLKATQDRSDAQKQIYVRCFETKAVKTMYHSGKSHFGRSVVWLILLISESNSGVTGFFFFEVRLRGTINQPHIMPSMSVTSQSFEN